MTHDTHDVLRFAIPSKGRIAEPVQAFLASCGLAVSRPNPRQYAATIPTCPVVSVLFAHAEEIPGKVREGTVDVGMTGLDKLYESGEEDDERAQVIFSDLGIGRARIVLGVPEGWIDAWSVADLADLAVQYRDRGRDLRVSTDFPNITRSFLHRHGIHAFELLPTEGAVESAPSLGLADLVSTLLETGTSFRENRLKVLRGGTILATETCCIANLRTLRRHPEKLGPVKQLLELFEARRRAQGFYSVVANIRGSSPDAVARHIWERPTLAGIQGPTIARVYGPPGDPGDWYAATLVVPTERLTEAVQHLRDSGGSGITAVPAAYVFESQSHSFTALEEKIERGRPRGSTVG